MTSTSDMSAIQKWGITYYAETEAALKLHDQAYGNGDGNFTVDEFKFEFISQNKNIFKNDATKKGYADSLVNKQTALFVKYAGQDGVLSTEEYAELINSGEYNKFISEYRTLIGTDKTQEAKTNEIKETTPAEAIQTSDNTREIVGEINLLMNMAPTIDKRYMCVFFVLMDFKEMAQTYLQGAVSEMSFAIGEYFNTNMTNKSPEEIDKALEACTEKLKKIQEEAIAKIAILQQYMKALNQITEVMYRTEPNQINYNEVLQMLTSSARKTSGDISNIDPSKKGKVKGEMTNEKKTVNDKIEKYTKIIEDPEASKEEKAKAAKNIELWSLMFALFEELTK